MDTAFAQNGIDYHIVDGESIQFHKKLPPAVYHLNFEKDRGFWLVRTEDFSFDGKVYGDLNRNADRIISTFMERPNTTGVLLSGPKGTGKTMLARLLAERCVTQISTPVVIINTNHTEETRFFPFLNALKQRTMILFDEFEKVFDDKAQEKILTLLDGTFPSRKMFVLTVNYTRRINENISNRPGRLYYNIQFGSLDAEFIRGYCKDHAISDEHCEEICRLSTLYYVFTFDMLKAIVEEMNRYNESPGTVIKLLNAKPESESAHEYDVVLYRKGKPISKKLYRTEITLNPLQDQTHIWVHIKKDTSNLDDLDEPDDDDDGYVELPLKPEDLKSFDMKEGVFRYIVNFQGDQWKVELKKRPISGMTGDYSKVDFFK